MTRVCHVKENIPGAIYIGRANFSHGLKASIFANPHRVGDAGIESKQDAITRYLEHAMRSPEILRALPSLRGQWLACWCRYSHEEMILENACHGDVIRILLRNHTDDQLREFARRCQDDN